MCEQNVERCPTLADLVCVSDGSLAPASSDFVWAHVHRCPACRDQLREIDEAVRPGSTAPGLPVRLSYGARGARKRASRFDLHFHHYRQDRIHKPRRRPVVGWLSVAAMGPILVGVGMLLQTHSVVVRADELLQRVATQQRARPDGSMAQVRIRWTRPTAPRQPGMLVLTPGYAPRSIVRELADGSAIEATQIAFDAASPGALRFEASDAAARSASDGAAPLTALAIARLMARHHFDWQQPLNIEHFQAWRGSLRAKHDHLTLTGDMLVTLRTTTTDGELRDAEVVVRRDTWQVVRETLVFAGVGRLEFETMAEWRREDGADAVRAASAVEVTVPAATADLLAETELDARLVLRQTGLDLGGDLRVSQTRDAVRVEGVVPSDAARRTLSARLSALSHVRVSLRAAEAPARVSETSGRGGPGAAETAAVRGDGVGDGAADGVGAGDAAMVRVVLSQWRARTFGDRAETAGVMFLSEVPRLVTVVSQRLASLQELSGRYAGDAGDALSPRSRAKLRRLADLHYRALNDDLHALDTRLAVLFGSTARALPLRRAPADWARRTASSLVHAETLGREVRDLLAREDLPSGPALASTSVTGAGHAGATFDTLWDIVNAGGPGAARPE